MKITIIPFLIFLLLVLASVSHANPETIKVPTDYSTIQKGIDAAGSGDTVLVASGTYHENNIQMKAGVVILGAGIDSTIVDGDGADIFVGAYNATLSGFTLTNGDDGIRCYNSAPVIQFNKITNCSGSGIYTNDTTLIKMNLIVDNGGTGIFCSGSYSDNTGPVIVNNLIAFNSSDGITSVSADVVVMNNTLDNNKYAVWIQGNPDDQTPKKVICTNNIITNSSNYGFYISNSEAAGVDPSHVTMTYNDVWNNSTDYRHWTPDSTDISDNPWFVGTKLVGSMGKQLVANESIIKRSAKDEAREIETSMKDKTFYDRQHFLLSSAFKLSRANESVSGLETSESDYHLQSVSPCIDKGDPNSPFDPDGSRADMGAFFYDQTVGSEFLLANKMQLFQNYPNPFSSVTTIRFQLAESSSVSAVVYDATGNLVKTITCRRYESGFHILIWNGRNDSEMMVPAGIYLIQIRAGNFVSTKKMIFN